MDDARPAANKDGGPAFPRSGFESSQDILDWPEHGMSLRDYFRAAVLPEVLREVYRQIAQGDLRGEDPAATIAAICGEIADGLLAAPSETGRPA